MQNTLLKIYGGINEFRGELQFYAWVRTVATRCGLDALRASNRQKNKKTISLRCEDEIEDNRVYSALPEMGNCLEEVLVKLGEEHQKVFDLIYKQRKKQKEAAEILGVDAKTIYNKRERILEALRLCVEKLDP